MVERRLGPGVSFQSREIEKAIGKTAKHSRALVSRYSPSPEGFREILSNASMLVPSENRLIFRKLSEVELGRLAVGVRPEFKASINSTEVLLSRPFISGSGREVVVAWVNKDGAYSMNLLYKSFSHGLWKHHPYLAVHERINVEREQSVDKLIGKMDEEEHRPTAPIDLQIAISEIENRLARGAFGRFSFSKAMTPRKATLVGGGSETSGVLTHEVPMGKFLALDDSLSEHFVDVRDGCGQGPDFSRLEHVFPIAVPGVQVKNAALGMHRFGFVFPSTDGKLRFLFMLDSLGRTWLVYHELAGNELNQLGLNRRVSYVHAGSQSPAVDHETHGEGSLDMGRLEDHGCAYETYADFSHHSHAVPLVRGFREWLGKNGFKLADTARIREFVLTSRGETRGQRKTREAAEQRLFEAISGVDTSPFNAKRRD